MQQRRADLPAVLELHELQRRVWILQQLLGARLVLRLIGWFVWLSAELGASSSTAAAASSSSSRCELPGLVGAVVRVLRRLRRWWNTAPGVFCHARCVRWWSALSVCGRRC